MKDIVQGLRADLCLQSTAMMALQEAGDFFGGPSGTIESVRTACKVHYNHAEGHIVS